MGHNNAQNWILISIKPPLKVVDKSSFHIFHINFSSFFAAKNCSFLYKEDLFAVPFFALLILSM